MNHSPLPATQVFTRSSFQGGNWAIVARKRHFGLLFLLLMSLTTGLRSQVLKETFPLSGPCTSCGKTRLDSVLRTIPGVKSCAWSPGSPTVTVEFDKAATSLITIQLELSVKGYNAGDFDHTPGMGMSSCCGKPQPVPVVKAQVNPPPKTVAPVVQPKVKTPPPAQNNDSDEEDEDLLDDEDIFDEEIPEDEEFDEVDDLDVDDFPEDEKDEEEDPPN